MSVRPDAPREEGDAGDRGQEAELRGPASSRQRQHRQATRFLHKDSADLLPLDGLKRLGTSKDWVRLPSPLPTPGGPGSLLSSAGGCRPQPPAAPPCPRGGERQP